MLVLIIFGLFSVFYLFTGGLIMLRRLAFVMAVLICFQAGFAFAQKKSRKTGATANKTVVDRKAPVVLTGSSLNPMDGGLINNAKPTISAEYVDEGIGISPADTKLFVDGQDVSANAQIQANKTTYIPSSPLADGLHKVALSVVDKAGNVTSTAWSFSIHTLPPVVKITSHKANQFVNQSPVIITGTVNDPKVRIVVNGINAFIEKGVFSAKVNLNEGGNMITAVATDAFGNTGSDAVSIVIDTKPPFVEITSPSVSSLLNTKLVTVTGIVDKNAVTVTVGNKAGENYPAEITAGKFTAKDIKLDEGVNTITVKAVSLAGNVGKDSVRVTVDSIPPKVTITGPKDMTVTNKKMITVTGMVDKASAMVKVNNTLVQITRGVFTLSSLSLQEGANAITATAIDRAGNQAAPAVVNVVLDTTPPAAPTLNPLPPVTRMIACTVTGTAEAGGQVEIYVNSASQGKAKADEKGFFSLKVNLTEGNNAVTVTATDAPGNTSAPSAVTNVFLDTKPPRLL